jgi:hypothetical protein
MKQVFLIAITVAFLFTSCKEQNKTAPADVNQINIDDAKNVENNSGNIDIKTDGGSVTVDKNGISVKGEDGESVKIDENGVTVDDNDGNEVKMNENGVSVKTGDTTKKGVTVDGKGNVKVNAGGIKVDVQAGKIKIN